MEQQPSFNSSLGAIPSNEQDTMEQQGKYATSSSKKKGSAKAQQNPNQMLMTGFDPPPDTRAKLEQRFIIPPFSVLDTRQGYWQNRKKQWISLGIKSEEGRGMNLLNFSDTVLEASGIRKKNLSKHARTFGEDLMKGENTNFEQKQRPDGVNFVNGVLYNSDSGADPSYYSKKRKVEADLGREISTKEFQEQYYEGMDEDASYHSGTSIFDPVLCELMYKWFCPPDGHILDPFSGGSVRGIVATTLGYDYTGIDLSAAQVEANKQQVEEIKPPKEPTWIVGDSNKIDEMLANKYYDMIFSCPPYHNLEVYTDNEDDLSNMSWERFSRTYSEIIHKSILRLKPNRFAVFVVSEIRDNSKEGAYKQFVPLTINSFSSGGARYYNDIILLNNVGSLSIRIGKQFGNYRKIGKTHQNILVFYKGDVKSIPRYFKKIKTDYSIAKTWGDNEAETGIEPEGEEGESNES